MDKYSRPILHGLNAVGQLIVLSMLWTVCCLPVVTIGASSTALYYTVVKVVRRDRGRVLSAFFTCFRENFWQSVSVNLCYLGIFAVLALAALPRLLGGDIPYAVLGLTFLVLIPFAYSYPVLSRFYHKGGALARFLLLLSGRYVYVGALCAALLLGAAVLVLSNGASLLFVPGIYAYIQSLMLEPLFRRYSSQTDEDRFKVWYDGDGDHADSDS